MELTKQSIFNYKTLIPGIEGYSVLVSKIEDNVSSNPDISIESCKSLIEGLCLKALSLISDKYNSSKSLQTKCKNDLRTLTNLTFDEVYSNYVESQIHESLSNMVIDISIAKKIKDNAKRMVKEQTVETIGKVSAVRNERGDISHGRNYPKEQESSIKLAKSILSITDGICSFMIEEFSNQYRVKFKVDDKLVYDKLEDFNNWLDDLHNVSIIKIDFSKLLYENAYEKYEEYYYLEYIPTTESLDDPIQNESLDTEPTSKSIEKKYTELITTFDEIIFWTIERISLLEGFAHENDFEPKGLKEIIEKYIAFDDEPLRDDIAKIMINKPPLSERKKTLLVMMEFIIDFAEDLKNL